MTVEKNCVGPFIGACAYTPDTWPMRLYLGCAYMRGKGVILSQTNEVELRNIGIVVSRKISQRKVVFEHLEQLLHVTDTRHISVAVVSNLDYVMVTGMKGKLFLSNVGWSDRNFI